MPHVDELLGVTTLASMGLLVAVALQPVEDAQRATTPSAEKPVAAAPRLIVAGPAAAGQPRPSAMPAATAKERT